jgi:hypothetical protein
MQIPVTNYIERSKNDAGPIRCAPLSRLTAAQRQISELLQGVVVGVAILAMLLLMASAFCYTSHHQSDVRHVRLLPPHLPTTHQG